MLRRLRSPLRNERGSATAEYALVAAVVFLVTYAGFNSINTEAANQLVGTQSGLTCSSVYATAGTTAVLDASGNLTCVAGSPSPSPSAGTGN